MSYPGMPQRVLIDGIPYEVIVEFKSDEYDDGTDGEFNVSFATIKLRAGLAPGYAKVTLLHECLHGLWEHRGFTAVGRPAALEEEVVTGLSYGLFEMMRTNPELVEWLRS